MAPSSNERFRSSIREPILVQFLGIHRNIRKGEWGGAPAIILYQQNRLTPIAKSATVPGKKKKASHQLLHCVLGTSFHDMSA